MIDEDEDEEEDDHERTEEHLSVEFIWFTKFVYFIF
jgi:hypothetical protein